MSDQIIHHFLKLDEHAYLQILRGMMGGEYSEALIVAAVKDGNLHRLALCVEVVSKLDRSIARMIDWGRDHLSPSQAKAKNLLENYKKLSFMERLQQRININNQLTHLIPNDDCLFYDFKKTMESDVALILAADILVSVSAHKLYEISNASTKNGHIPALMLMRPSNQDKMVNTSFPELNQIVNQFRKSFLNLIHSNISEDKKPDLLRLVEYLIDLEVNHWAPINKIMRFLYSIHHDLAKSTLKNRSFFVAPQTPDSMIKLKEILATLQIDLLYGSCINEKDSRIQSQIIPVFHQVQRHIEKEIKSISNSFMKNEELLLFYNTQKAQIDVILKDDAEARRPFVMTVIESREARVTSEITRQQTSQNFALEQGQNERERRTLILTPFSRSYSRLASKINELNCHDGNLLQNLQEVENDYLNLDIDINIFKSRCSRLIATALQSDLAKQPFLVQLLYDTAFALTTLVTLGGANLISYMKTGSFRFFEIPPSEVATRIDAVNTNVQHL